MPVYNYEAMDDKGDKHQGVIDADSPKEARSKLIASKLFVTRLNTAETKPKRQLRIFQRRNIQDLAMVTRQLATMLGSGIPLTGCLSAVIEQAEDKLLKTILLNIREKVTQGTSFSEALDQYRSYFGDLYINMVKAGEASGNLDVVMYKISDYLLTQHRITSRITAALTYPIVMIVIAFLVILFLLTFVVPKVVTVLKAQKAALPLPTLILTTTADIVAKIWPFIIIGLIILVLLMRRIYKTEKGRLAMDSFMLRIPVLGPLFRKAAISRFCSTFATLLESGLPAVESLQVVSQVVNNQVITNVILKARKRIQEGTDIATPFKESKEFPPVVCYMISVGEESGQLDKLLRKMSQAYDEELEIQAQKLTSLLEPLLILFMAGIVAFIVLSILLPILQMTRHM